MEEKNSDDCVMQTSIYSTNTSTGAHCLTLNFGQARFAIVESRQPTYMESITTNTIYSNPNPVTSPL